MTDPDLIKAAIKASGLSVRGFARDVLTRDPRTVFRWMHGPDSQGMNELPRTVRERCEAIVKAAASAEPSGG